MDGETLSRKIKGRYGSQKNFAKEINWHENKVSKMVQGSYIPDVDEAALISMKLELSLQEHKDIFLRTISPYGDILGADNKHST